MRNMLLWLMLAGCAEAAAKVDAAKPPSGLVIAAEMLEHRLDTMVKNIGEWHCSYRDVFLNDISKDWHARIVIEVAWDNDLRKDAALRERYLKIDNRTRAVKERVMAIPTGDACYGK